VLCSERHRLAEKLAKGRRLGEVSATIRIFVQAELGENGAGFRAPGIGAPAPLDGQARP
jgi:hypothetical protein